MFFMFAHVKVYWRFLYVYKKVYKEREYSVMGRKEHPIENQELLFNCMILDKLFDLCASVSPSIQWEQ